MSNKPIIIDGVDVSECGHYHYGKCEIDYDEWNNEIIRYNECQNNPNCYFKQLKRKEQECEELKKEVELLKQYKGSKQASYERMQIDWNKAVSQNRDLLKQVEGWQDKYNQLKAENKQAEQKLKFVENVLYINYQLWMYYIANGINNSSNHTILDLIEDFATSVRLLANTLDIQDNTLNYYTKDSIVYDKKNKELQKLNNEVENEM